MQTKNFQQLQPECQHVAHHVHYRNYSDIEKSKTNQSADQHRPTMLISRTWQRLTTSACVVLLGGPNLLDEEAAVKSAVGMSSLTSGFTIWLSKGCACLLSSIAVISEMSLSGSSTSALASSSGRSRTIDTHSSAAALSDNALVWGGAAKTSSVRSKELTVGQTGRGFSGCSTRYSEDIICRDLIGVGRFSCYVDFVAVPHLE